MTFASRLGDVLSYLPAKSELCYRMCRRVVDRYRGESDLNMATNGEFHLLRHVLPRASVVFDVGANVGDWILEALKVNPRARYHCFEPSQVTFRALTARNLPSNVTANNCGLGEAPQARTLFVFDDACGANSLYKRVGTLSVQQREETVRIRTVDEYCASEGIERVDFLKTDVEGHELAVLRGARRMFAEARIGMVQFEYGDTFIDARVFLKDIWQFVRDVNADYQFFKIYPTEIRRISEYSQSFERFTYSNWLILHPSAELAGLRVR